MMIDYGVDYVYSLYALYRITGVCIVCVLTSFTYHDL